MATYAIGDIQGCYQTLQKLLKRINFNPDKDRLWLTGDLINRGPRSLETLRLIYQLRDNVTSVLGNHDLHFLAVESGCMSASKYDTFEDILSSPEREKLVDWYRQQPLAVYHPKLDYLMVHAGLHPGWSPQDALERGKELAEMVSSSRHKEFFSVMYGNKPDHWQDNLEQMNRLRYITNCLTRMRYLKLNGKLEFSTKTPPGTQPENLKPWYEFDNPTLDCQLVFGHWGWLKGSCSTEKLNGVDSGCVYGGELTAMRLEDKKRFHYPMVD